MVNAFRRLTLSIVHFVLSIKFLLWSYSKQNKKTGTTYTYESISYWDKDKKQSRARRRCIGKVESKTLEIIPTRKKKTDDDRKTKPGPVPVTWNARCFYREPYLFDQVGKDTGEIEDFKKRLFR